MPTLRAAAAVMLAGLAGSARGYTAPNVVFMLADDIGWSDMGYFGYDLADATPNMDMLAGEGIKLNCVYGQTACSPGRAAFLSGRYPMRFGMQKGAINQQQRKGVFTNHSLISDELHKVGYATAMVGKWHIGHASWTQTPMYRGFDTYYGFMCTGQIDFLKKTQDGYLDMYQDAERVTDEYALSEDTRSSWLYEAHAEDFIRSHAAKGTAQPFFLYYALQDPHTPLQSPDYFLESEPCVNMQDETRQVYCGMMRCIDTAVEGIMVAISESGYYNNTLFLFSGDNGGAPKNGGYNWPMRGSKGTLFEGGVRQASWMWGMMIPEALRGTTYDGAMHLVDFFPTILSVATAGQWQPNLGYDLDGQDLWTALVTAGTSPRTTTVLNVLDQTGGVRVGDYVLLYGVKNDGWYAQPDMQTGYKSVRMTNLTALRADCATVTVDNVTGEVQGDECNYLFDVVTDPTEETNLYNDMPDLVSTMLATLQTFCDEAVDYNTDSDKEDGAKEVAAETGYWGPWLD